MKVVDGITIFGEAEEGSIEQIKRCAEDETVFGAALMADNHKGYSMPIGGVVAYRNAVSPSGVGYDIACGLKAVRTSLYGWMVKSDLPSLMDRIFKEVQFGIGKTTGGESDHELFDDPTWKDVKGLIGLKRLAAQQLGTVGSGNHFVDLLVDENDAVWVMAHFGSRGFGHKTATGFLNLANGREFDDKGKENDMDSRATVFSLESEIGMDYFQAMKLAGRYAYAGRDAVVAQVLDILGVNDVWEEVHNHHNFAWEEIHNGEKVVVVRKGATPNSPGQISAIGGSMGDISVIVEGVDSDLNLQAMTSTVHGAGRVLSRTAALGKFDKKTKQRVGGKVTREMMSAWLTNVDVVLRGAGTDESPHCYKRLPEVLKEHEGTIKIKHTLRPIGVAMAGANEVDPYKD